MDRGYIVCVHQQVPVWKGEGGSRGVGNHVSGQMYASKYTQQSKILLISNECDRGV